MSETPIIEESPLDEKEQVGTLRGIENRAGQQEDTSYIPGESSSNGLEVDANLKYQQHHGENNDFDFNFQDPGTWSSKFSDSQRCYITKMRKELQIEPDLSNSLRNGRKLTKEWFFKQMPNGQKVPRSWLGYSNSKNALYCIPCRLFSHLVSVSEAKLYSLVKEEGSTQWKKLSERISEHENSLNHKFCFCSWKMLESSME